MAAETVKDVATMADRRNLSLTDHEVREVAAIVDQTGDFAPEAEVVARFADGALTPRMLTFSPPGCGETDRMTRRFLPRYGARCSLRPATPRT